jgi:hypothetical protein
MKRWTLAAVLAAVIIIGGIYAPRRRRRPAGQPQRPGSGRTRRSYQARAADVLASTASSPRCTT